MHATVSPSLLPRRSPLRHRPLALALATCLCGLSFAAQAQVAANQLPTGGSIAGGTGVINAASGSTLTIDQTSQRMALNWSSFDIGSASTVNFNQPSSSAVVLNQIQGGNPTQIFGNLNANGQVFLINTNGMIFGSTANINVGGLVASTLGTSASSFMSGDMTLDAGANTVALMSNGGTINAAAGGVSLIAGKAVNSGTITAAAGNINLVGADRVVLQFESGGFGVVVEKPLQLQLDTLAVDNAGSLIAPGGNITLQARAAQGVFSQLINQSGVINAAAISSNGFDGSVSLIAQGSTGGNIGGNGSINAGSGALNVSASIGAELGGVLTAGDLNVFTGGTLRLNGSNQIARLGGSVGGNLALTNARDLAQAGDLTVTGTSAFALGSHALVLDSASNDFGGAVAITAGDTRIRDANALTLGALSTGALTVTSGGALNLGSGSVNGALAATSSNGIGQAGALTIAGDAAINAGSGAIVLLQENDFAGNAGFTGNGINVQDRNTLRVASVTSLGGGDVSLAARGSLLTPVSGLGSAGTVTLSADGGTLELAGPVSGHGVALFGRDGITFGNNLISFGALLATTSNGVITQASGAVTVAGMTGINTGTAAISLGSAANHFGGPVSLTGGTTLLRDSGALTLGNVVTGALTVTSGGALSLGRGAITGALSANSNGNAISQTGTLLVTGTATVNAGAGSIALAQQNDFMGGVALTGSSIDLADANNLTVTAVTTSGVGNVNLVAAGALSLPATGLSAAGNVRLRAEGGALTLGGDISGNTVSLYSQDALTLGSSITTADTLTVSTANRAINQTGGALAVGGASSFDVGSGSISLGSANNHFAGAVGLTGRTTLIRDSGALTLGTLSTGALTVISGGTLNLGSGTADSLVAVSNGNAIVQTGGLIVAQASTIVAGSGSITLDNAANDFQGGVALTGGSMAVRDRNNLAVTSLTSGTQGSITLHAGGALTLPAQAINAGTGTVTLIADGDTLATAGTVQGGAVTLRGHGGLRLGHDIAATSLTLNTDNDAITQTAGALTVQAATTVNAGSGDIALLGVANDFNTLAVAGGSIGVYDQNDLSVSSLSSGVGSVALTAGGTLSLPWGDIDVGTANLSLRSLGGTLSTRGNLAAGNVSLAARDGLTLGDQITAGNTLSLSSSSGGITQTAGAVTAGGATSADAGGAIRLGNSNRFGGGIGLTGNDVLVRDSDDLTVTALNVGANGSVTLRAGGALYLPAQTIDTGSLSLFADGGSLRTAGALRAGTVGMTARDGLLLNHDVSATNTLSLTTANAAITQTAGVLSVGGSTRVDAGNASIVLGSIGNQFAGGVDLAGGTVQIAGNALALGTVSADALSARSAGALNLGTATVRGALTATSGSAAITQAGALSVGGDATFNAGTGAITLTHAGNDFAGALSLNGGDAVVAAGTALRLGDSQLGSLHVDAAADLTVAGQVEATAIDLASNGVFRNVRGADALRTPGGRWLVRLLDPNGGHVFNGLDSGNSAVWNIGAGDTVSQAGNRYAFAFRPVLTVSSSNASKVYGSVADLSPHWRVTGLMDGVAGAYAGDDLAGVLRGAPTLDSAGAAATASVAGGPYGITTGLGTLDTGSSGYALATADSGQLTVTPASLVIQAGNAGKIYGSSTANLATFTTRGLLNNDTVTSLEQSSAGRAASSGVGSYAITAGNASGTGLSNYAIDYVAGTLTVDPATLRVIAADTTRAPDSAALLAYYTEGLFNGDAVTSATLSSAGTSSLANPGAYAISVSGATGTGLSNYRIEYVPGTLLVRGYNPLLITGAAQAINALVPPPSMALALPPATATRVPAAYTVSAVEAPTTDAPATCLRDNVLAQCRAD